MWQKLRQPLVFVLSLGLLGPGAGCANFDDSSLFPFSVPQLQALLRTAWWDSSYSIRREIVFGTAHSALSKGYTVTLGMDTSSSAGVALTSGNDVRIVWQPLDTDAVELDRIGNNWNSSSTTIDFRLQTAITANQNTATEGSYYVYFGNSAASTPPTAEANVYYFADFFDRTDSTTIGGGWTEWTANSGDASLVSGRLELVGNDVALDSGVKQDFALGAIPGDFTLSFDWRVVGITQGTWAQLINVGSTAMSDTDLEAGVAMGLYFGEGGTINPDNLYNMDNDYTAANQIENGVISDVSAYTTWSIVLDADQTAQTFTYSRDGTQVGASHAFADTSITSLSQIRMGAWNWASALNPYAFDNVKLILKVSDGPEPALSTTEYY